jgi:hypothetical protein
MNEQQIQELKNLVDKLLAEGLSRDKIQSQINAKKQEFLGKTSPVGQGAPAEVTAAPGMEFKSDPGSLGLNLKQIQRQIPSGVPEGISPAKSIYEAERERFTKPIKEKISKEKSFQTIAGKNEVQNFLLGTDDILKNYSEDDDFYKLLGVDLKGKNIIEKYNNNPDLFEKTIKNSLEFGPLINQEDKDNIVRSGIKTFLEKNTEKEFINDLNTVKDNKAAGTYEPIVAKGIQNSLIGKIKEEQEYITINNQIRNLILERDNAIDQNKFNDYQSQIKKLKIKADALSPSIKILKGKDMFINPLNGKFTDPLLSSDAISYEDNYNSIVKTYQNKTLESLENEFFLTQLDKYNLADRENKKYRIYVDKAYIQQESKLGGELEQAGYEIKDGNKGDKTGYIDNISYNDLMNLAGDETDFFGLGFWENITIFDVDGTE